MFRTRFKKEIVAEFLPPSRSQKKQRVIILCDGMPSIPRKQSFAYFLSRKGFWVIYPRYRGSWESGGAFLKKSPHIDILDVIGELPKGMTDPTFGKKFKLSPDEIFVIGGSFGGPAAILASLDPRVKKVVATCPVVDWPAQKRYEKVETSNKNYAAFLREAFGSGYRLSDKDWKKLYSGTFYNPMRHVKEIDPSKIFLLHAKDDPVVPWRTVQKFSNLTGARLKLLSRGGHLSTSHSVERYWPLIKKFFS